MLRGQQIALYGAGFVGLALFSGLGLVRHGQSAQQW